MADTIRLKAPVVEQQVIVNIQGEEKLKSLSDTLGKISRGKNLQKYWKEQESLINDAIEAYKKFGRVSSQDNASELLKITNALKAMGNTDISTLSPELKNINDALSQAKTIAGSLDDAFSVSSFKGAFDSFETLRAYGLEMEEMFRHFEINADVDKLNRDLTSARSTISSLTAEVDELQYKLDESESGNGIAAIRSECEDLRWEIDKIREDAEELFAAFLKSNNINSDDFEEYFKRIRRGSMTAQDAIADFKREYYYLLEGNTSFDITQLQDFSKRLEDVLDKVKKISVKIDEISSNGVKVSDVSSTGNIDGLVDVVNKIEQSGGSGGASAIYESLSKILTIIKEIAQADTNNVYNLYSAILNLSKLNDLKINKASLNNLADAIERICNIKDTSGLANLKLIDLSKFNDLHISKASLNNLATYLPQIAGINPDTLAALAKIDFSNLNNLKVDKASLENLKTFAESLRVAMQESTPDSSTKIEADLMEKVATSAKEASTAKKEFADANEMVQSSVNESKSPLQLEADLMDQIAKSAREAVDAKKEFVEANKQVEQSVDNSNSSMDNAKKKDKYAKRNKISEDDFLGTSDHYASIANQRLKDSGMTILGETVNTELVNGLVKVTAKIKDVDGSWKTFSARIDADGNMFEQRFRAITKNVDKLDNELEKFGKETAPALTYEQTVAASERIRTSLNLGEDYSVKVDSNELVSITKKLDDVEGAGVSVTQTFKSVQGAIDNFGKAASNSAEKTTIALKSVKKEAESISEKDIAPKTSDSYKDEIEKFKSDISSLQSELKSSFKGTDVNTLNFIDSLEKIIDKYKELRKVNSENKNLVSDEDMRGLKEYLSTFKMTIEQISLSDIGKKVANPTQEFTAKLKEAGNQLDVVKAALDKVEAGEAFTDEDISKVKQFISQMRELDGLSKLSSSKLANVPNMQHMLGEIAKTLNKNTAMSKELRQEFEALDAEMRKLGNNVSAEQLREFGARLEGLKTKLQASGKTGLSFFDGIAKKARSMSQNFIAMYLSFYDIIRYIKSGINTIRDLDIAFTEMRKVSDESVQSLKNFQEASFGIADAVGTTAQQIQMSTADWLRLGESMKEAVVSAEASNILFNVSEFENIDDATESLVAMSSAYSEFEKIEIVDRLNNIGNNYAIATDGIATALQRSASALKTSGNSIDEAIALVTAGNAVVQNPDSVGAGKFMPEHIVICGYFKY